MSTIDGLNRKYAKRVKSMSVLNRYLEKMIGIQNNSGLSRTQKASQSIELLNAMIGEKEYLGYKLIDDVRSIGSKYLTCVSSIEDYKKALLNPVNTSLDSVKKDIKSVDDAQKDYAQEKDSFNKKHNYMVDSVESLNKLMIACLRNSVSEDEGIIEEYREAARNIANREDSIVLRMDDPILRAKKLPETIQIGKYPIGASKYTILKDSGISSSFQELTIDPRNQGNTIIVTEYDQMENDQIDAFVLAYIFRFIESFPLGNVNIHIFDQSSSFLYKRLTNSFQNETVGENVRKTVQIHGTPSEITMFQDVICDDIFKKTSVDRPDLYSVYDDDSSDPFNLIIIRDGLVDGSGYGSTEALEAISSLSKPGDVGHKCGIRFLIVDNSISFTKNLTGAVNHLIESIRNNCETKLTYSDGSFSVNDTHAEVLRIEDNLDKYVQERSIAIADAIGQLEKSYVSLEDVLSDSANEPPGNIMYIPVGKCGGVTVELPLSCKDEDGTVAGQCIGYMAIGQSGAGKSSFFHSLVMNGCMKYSPKDLQFWLLDFKNGGASSKYSKSGIPHIKMIAENNKIDDALCLFQMVLEEMERRSNAFNKNFTDNIIEYNKIALRDGLEYFPRIIIAIDEVQEIFREDNASVIQKLISSISTRMRSSGMHFVMVAQNLSEGKSYMLKDAFLPSATGRICFRVAQDIPRDSGFDETFIDRRQEITELKTGEAYVSYGKDTIKKVKMAFISPQDMSEKYFARIRDRYSEYSNMSPLVIGSKKRLEITSLQQGTNTNYSEIIARTKGNNGIIKAVIGEDVYRMSPLTISFSSHENSAALFLGSDKRIASSLCTSTAISLIRQNVKVHLFNADRTRIQEGEDSVQHPFRYLCQWAAETGGIVENHRLDQLSDVMNDMYGEYLERRDQVQKSEFEDPTFSPVFLIVNDLFGIESFINNDMIEKKSEANSTDSENGYNPDNKYDLFEEIKLSKQAPDGFRESIQNIMTALLKNGYRYNMYIILAIKGDPSTWRSAHITSEINNVVLFNDTEYTDQVENAYYLKEMLKNISNDGSEETMAVWSSKKTFSKIRPLIYRLSSIPEKDAIDSLIKGDQP